MALDPNDPFFEGAIRNIVQQEISRSSLGVLIRQLQNGLVPTFTTAALPDPADMEAHVVYVSDAAAGSMFQGSDGASWLSLG